MKKNIFFAGRFIGTLKKSIYNYATSVSKNVYIDKLGEIVNKYNNTYHKNITIKTVDVTSSKVIDFGTESNNKDAKIKIVNNGRIFKYENNSI